MYVLGNDCRLHAFDAATGERRWPAPQLPPGSQSYHVVPVVSPDSTRVCVDDALGRVHCFDAETGKELWTSMNTSTGASTVGSFAPDGKRVLFPNANALVALDAVTGETLWTHSATLNGTQGPLVSRDGEWTLIAGADGMVHQLETDSGEPLRSPLRHPEGMAFASVPALSADEQTAYLMDTNGRILALDLEKGSFRWCDPQGSRPYTPGGFVLSPDGKYAFRGSNQRSQITTLAV